MINWLLKKIPGGIIGFLLGWLFVVLVLTHFFYLNQFIHHHQLLVKALGLHREIYAYYKFASILILFEVMLIGAVILYGYFLLRFSIIINRFKRSAESLGLDIHAPINKYSYSGIKVVEETRNVLTVMQKRIQNLIETRTKILSAISHDLRTPLTRLLMRAELLEPSERVNNIMSDAAEMEIMISEILSFSQDHHQKEKKVKVNLNKYLLKISTEFSEMGHSVSINENKTPIFFLCYPVRLKRVFVNILQNAMKYATSAHIQLSEDNQFIYIAIEDNGPGIPETYLKNVFKAFNRAGENEKPGIGLGLNIVHNIIEMHSGSIKLVNKDGGLQVSIQFPKAQPNLE